MMTRVCLGVLLIAVASPVRALALEILAPLEGTIVRSGEFVTVRVGPSAGESITSVRIATAEGNTEASAVAGMPGVFEGQVRVPLGAVGPELILVAADLSAGRLASTHVQVDADPGLLRRLVILQPPALTFTGQVIQLEVKGIFADGVTRDLTSPETGTQYETSNATVLAVDSAGLLQARSNGTASIRVRCRGLTATATLPVSLPTPAENAIPVAAPGPDRIVAPLTVVTLSGSASSDADGDPLTYLWEQLAGPWISLRSADRVSAAFLSPPVTVETVMEFSLTVKDNRGAASLPQTVRITVRP